MGGSEGDKTQQGQAIQAYLQFVQNKVCLTYARRADVKASGLQDGRNVVG